MSARYIYCCHAARWIQTYKVPVRLKQFDFAYFFSTDTSLRDGTDSWNRIMEQTQSSAEQTVKKGSWFMNDFNHIIYNDNIKLLLLSLGPDH